MEILRIIYYTHFYLPTEFNLFKFLKEKVTKTSSFFPGNNRTNFSNLAGFFFFQINLDDLRHLTDATSSVVDNKTKFGNGLKVIKSMLRSRRGRHRRSGTELERVGWSLKFVQPNFSYHLSQLFLIVYRWHL